MKEKQKMKGILTFFDPIKGIGWIDADNGETITVNSSKVLPTIYFNFKVICEVEERSGRLYATKIKPLKKKGKKK